MGCSVNHLSPSGAEVKERVELYLYYPFRPSWPVLGWSFPFSTFNIYCVEVKLNIVGSFIVNVYICV
jgi:hypothetical protein